MSWKVVCDGCGADMGTCRFPVVIEIGPNAGKSGFLVTRVELRPTVVISGEREIDVCQECVLKGIKARY